MAPDSSCELTQFQVRKPRWKLPFMGCTAARPARCHVDNVHSDWGSSSGHMDPHGFPVVAQWSEARIGSRMRSSMQTCGKLLGSKRPQMPWMPIWWSHDARTCASLCCASRCAWSSKDRSMMSHAWMFIYTYACTFHHWKHFNYDCSRLECTSYFAMTKSAGTLAIAKAQHTSKAKRPPWEVHGVLTAWRVRRSFVVHRLCCGIKIADEHTAIECIS